MAYLGAIFIHFTRPAGVIIAWPDFEGRCVPLLRSFCTSPENFCTSPEKSCTCLGKVSIIDENENLTFFGCLGSRNNNK